MSIQRNDKVTIKKLQELYNLCFSLEGSLFRYSLAYSLLLALLPMLIVIVILFQNSIFFNLDTILQYLYRFIPEDLIGTFVLYITNKSFPSGIPLLISLIVTLVLASRSIYSFLLISAKYEEYPAPKIVLRIKGFFLFVGIIISVFALVLFFAFMPFVGSLQLISTLLVLFVIFFFIYRTITFEKKPLSYGIHGTIFASVALAITGYLFLFLVRTFSSYASVYGPMASLVIALLSLYIIASIVYFGYAINLVFGSSYTKKEFKFQKYYIQIENKFKKLSNK
ncbi:MAG: YihY/virulence factor BrkB family protein [Anaerorhabdus sp.]